MLCVRRARWPRSCVKRWRRRPAARPASEPSRPCYSKWATTGACTRRLVRTRPSNRGPWLHATALEPRTLEAACRSEASGSLSCATQARMSPMTSCSAYRASTYSTSRASPDGSRRTRPARSAASSCCRPPRRRRCAVGAPRGLRPTTRRQAWRWFASAVHACRREAAWRERRGSGVLNVVTNEKTASKIYRG